MGQWDDHAACKGQPLELWFEPDAASVAAASAVCAGCPCRGPCLDWAVRNNEQHGVWGGLTIDRRAVGRRSWMAGDALAYSDWRARVLAGESMAAENLGECRRCGARVRPGPIPEDRNTAGATCGFVSTYSRGCRCDPCLEAKQASKARPSGVARGEAR